MERNLKKERKKIRYGEGGDTTVPSHKNQDMRCVESFPPPSSLLVKWDQRCGMGSEMWNGIRDVEWDQRCGMGSVMSPASIGLQKEQCWASL